MVVGFRASSASLAAHSGGAVQMLQSRLVKKTAATDRARIVQFACTIVSMNAYFEKIHQFWAKALGITAPQWSIIVVLAALDEGEGVPVNVVSKKADRKSVV